MKGESTLYHLHRRGESTLYYLHKLWNEIGGQTHAHIYAYTYAYTQLDSWP